jgi:integrase
MDAKHVSLSLVQKLAQVDTRQEVAQRESTTANSEIKGRIVEYAFWMKKEGYAEATITRRGKLLELLAKRGALLLDSESVKAVIAAQATWSGKTKELAVEAYSNFLKMLGMSWRPPNYRPVRKLPFIPTETEINELIAGCNKRTATFLQMLKETGMRCGEAWTLQWTDINIETKTVNVTPEKGSDPRMLRISDRLLSMLNSLPNDQTKIFEGSLRHFARCFRAQRCRVSRKLGNVRITKITFHTFRHWKATMEYAKTKDILHVMKMLGHRNIQNTLLYTQLVNFEMDDFHSATAKDVQEAQKLVEAGFEYVCDFGEVKLFRKRK